MKTLRLVMPGLLGPWQAESSVSYPRAKALTYLLSHATPESLDVKGADASLFKLFGLPILLDKDLPVAALTHLIDGRTTGEGWWLRADPVYLYADKHQVLLFDARTLDINLGEARTLVAEFNQAFHGEGLRLVALQPHRWYLQLPEDPGIRTEPLLNLVGRDIASFLPRGANARYWCRLLTEAQMLLHGSAVNRGRQATGQRPINGIWFWGGGVLPRPVNPRGDAIYASDPLAQGLARLSGAKAKAVPDTAFAWHAGLLQETQALIVLETTRYDLVDNAIDSWGKHVDCLDKDWFAPCLTLLRNKQLGQLVLYPCNGRGYTVFNTDIWRFWRRVRPLHYYTRA